MHLRWRCTGSYALYRVLLDTLASSTFLLLQMSLGAKIGRVCYRSRNTVRLWFLLSQRKPGKLVKFLGNSTVTYAAILPATNWIHQTPKHLKMKILLLLNLRFSCWAIVPIQHVQQLSLQISSDLLFTTLGRTPGEWSHSNSWKEHIDEIRQVYCLLWWELFRVPVHY